jgi:hypothetical protein
VITHNDVVGAALSAGHSAGAYDRFERLLDDYLEQELAWDDSDGALWFAVTCIGSFMLGVVVGVACIALM